MYKEEIFTKTIDDCLLRGIFIIGRYYEFLGWSNSQMRDHCVWMYAKDRDGVTAEHIRQSAGDFSRIKSVSKYCARFGQCFTQTEESVQITTGDRVRFEDDIKHNGYCFSDGIGLISFFPETRGTNKQLPWYPGPTAFYP